MNILFYFPTNKASVSLESLMEGFKKRGHTIFLLGHEEKGAIHRNVKKFGVNTYNYVISKRIAILYYLRHILYLIFFVKKNNINIVYSHIQPTNFIAVFAQFFTKARIIICRHHSDSAIVNNCFNEKLFDKIINHLGKEFIVPSKKVYDQMVINERVNKTKIRLIHYGYDFDKYKKPNTKEVNRIQEKYKCKLLIGKIARLYPDKRHIILFKEIKRLVNEGYDIKLICLSDGPLINELRRYIIDNNLTSYIFLLGFKDNIIDYIKVVDLIVHVSITEASNSLIKEAGLIKKPVMVCKGVGDFDDYIDDSCGFLLPKEDPSSELYEQIKIFYNTKNSNNIMGNNLYKKVLNTFSIDQVLKNYPEIIR